MLLLRVALSVGGIYLQCRSYRKQLELEKLNKPSFLPMLEGVEAK